MAVFCEAVPFQNANTLEVHPVFRGRQHIHLMADTPEELRLAARKYRLKYAWIQYEHSYREHFDVVGSLMRRVMEDDSVLKLERRAWVNRWRDNKDAYEAELKRLGKPIIPIGWYYAIVKGDAK